MTNQWSRQMRSGIRQIGMWVASGSAYVTEICLGAGMDWVLLDHEHAPNDLRSTLTQLQAAAGYPSVEVVVRPPVADPIVIKQLLDIGVRNLMLPMIDTAEQAAAVVAATRYPPAGIRGVGSALARASAWNRQADYLRTADDTLSVTVQIESESGLAALPEIAAVDGVDAIFIGPADLAAALGHLGEPEHPDVVATVEGAINAIVAAGRPAGVNAFNETLARRYLAAGATFVLVGADVALLARGAERLAQTYREVRDMDIKQSDTTRSDQ